MDRPATITRVRRELRRGFNVALKLRAGLSPRPESISPETPTDLFQALLSIYLFFSNYAQDRRVLDLGCGCGHGSGLLLERGASEVVGVDVDKRAIAFATRRYRQPGASFQVADAENLPRDIGPFDVVVSSNVFEHLTDPARGFDGVLGLLRPGGVFALAVPPIQDEASMAENESIRYHRSNLRIEQWLPLLADRFVDVEQFAHGLNSGLEMDLSSPFPSKLRPEDFWFDRVPSASVSHRTLTALFVARAPDARQLDKDS